MLSDFFLIHWSNYKAESEVLKLSFTKYPIKRILQEKGNNSLDSNKCTTLKLSIKTK